MRSDDSNRQMIASSLSLSLSLPTSTHYHLQQLGLGVLDVTATPSFSASTALTSPTPHSGAFDHYEVSREIDA